MIKYLSALCLLILTVVTVVYGQKSELKLFNSFPESSADQTGTYLIHPYDLSISENLIFVSDAKDCCIKVFNEEGTFIRRIGSRGRGPGELLDPFVFSIDNKNRLLYCDDKTNGRISIFRTNGDYVRIMRVFLPYYDIAVLKENLFTSSFNDINHTLFCKYNSNGKLVKSFGNMASRNHENYHYARTLYESELFSDGERLYAFFIKLPLCHVYSPEGELTGVIKFSEYDLEKLGNKNIEGAKERKETGLIPVKSWLYGVFIADGRIYCYSRTVGNKMYVFDHSGKLIEYLQLNCGEEATISDRLYFRHVDKNLFFFTDLGHAKIRIFKKSSL